MENRWHQAALICIIYIILVRALSGKLDVNISPPEMIVPPGFPDPILLRCSAGKYEIFPNTTFTIYWTFNGQSVGSLRRANNSSVPELIQRMEDVQVLEDSSLFIGRLTTEKEGQYACTARLQNSEEILSEDRSEASVYFARLSDFSLVPLDTAREEGSSVTLTCISGFSMPAANVTWMKTEAKIRDGIQAQHVLSRDEKTGMFMTSASLQFGNLTLEDHGEYYCVAINNLLPSEVKVSRRVFLKVKEKPSRPSIVLSPEDVYFVEGQSSRLLCISSGSPVPKISWFRNNVNVEDSQGPGKSPDFSSSSYGHTSVLDIPISDDTKAGEYKCLAENKFGKAISDSAQLRLATFSWTFIQEPENTEVHIGESVTLICRPPSSQPPATVSWYKDNQVIDLLKRTNMWQLPSGDLYMSEVSLNDAGRYFCNAFNNLLQATSSSQRAKLVVYAPPTLTKLPDSLEVVLERTVKLECNVTGFPQPTIMWTKNGLPLVENKRIIYGMGNQTVFITNAEISDGAIYGCTAMNKWGNDTTGPTMLNINVPPVIYSKMPERDLIELNEPHTIRCAASGVPTPSFNWTKDGIPLNPLEDSHLSLLEFGLKISNVTEADRGIYNCTAFNKAGVVWSKGTIDVKVPVEITTFSSLPTVNEFGNISFTCEARGYPEVIYEWVFKSSNLSYDVSFQHTTISYTDSATTIRLDNVTREHQGTVVTCIARNFWSNANVSTTIDVLFAPIVVEVVAIDPNPLIPGSNVTVQCSTEGRPAPHIKWMYTDKHHQELTPLNEKKRFELVGNHTMLLSFIEEKDEGIIKCVAENSVGTATGGVQISVLDKPVTITDFNLTAISSTSIKMSWIADDFERNIIKSFLLIYHEENDAANVTTQNVTANQTLSQAVVNGLQPATTYVFRISARNQAGKGQQSVEYAATTHPDAPSTPLSLSVDFVTSNSFEVKWLSPMQPNGNITQYEIKYRKVSPGEYFPQERILASAIDSEKNSYPITDLDPFSTYIVTVKAGTSGTNGNMLWGEYAPSVMVDTAEDAPSSAPPNAKLKAISPTSLLVTWSHIPQSQLNGIITEYKLNYEDLLMNISLDVGVNYTEVSHILNSLTPWREYEVRICGVTSGGYGPWSATLRETTLASHPTATVVGFFASSVTNTSIEFEWSLLKRPYQNGPDLHYVIMVAPSENFVVHDEYNTEDKRIMIDDLQPWTEYRAKIKAKNSAKGSGPWSEILNIRTNASVPERCRNLRLLDATWESITIQWEAPTLINGELQGYIVQYNALFCSDPEYQVERGGKRCSSVLSPHETNTQPPLVPPHKQNKNWKLFVKKDDAEGVHNNTDNQNSEYFAKANVLPTVVEGPLVEEMVYVGGEIDKITHKISPLLEFTVYRITVQAKNSAGRGSAIAAVGATEVAPRTNAVVATTDVSTTVLSTTVAVTEAGVDFANSTLIAATTAGAIFITLIILLVAISKWIRMNGAKHEAKNFHIPDSPIIPKSFQSSGSLDGVITRRTDLPTSSCEPLAAMTSFIGSTERLQQDKDKDIPAKYSFRNYERRPSLNLSDSDTEFEYAVIREGFKAFGEGLSRQRETVGLYAQSDNPHRNQTNEQMLRTKNQTTNRLGNEDSSTTAKPHRNDILFKHAYNGPYPYGQFNQNDNNRSHELPGDRLSGNWRFEEDDTYL